MVRLPLHSSTSLCTSAPLSTDRKTQGDFGRAARKIVYIKLKDLKQRHAIKEGKQ